MYAQNHYNTFCYRLLVRFALFIKKKQKNVVDKASGGKLEKCPRNADKNDEAVRDRGGFSWTISKKTEENFV